jgi:hypothetical protein
VDDRDRRFDPINELYKFKGNLECNKQLQPGFEEDMAYVYLVPADAKIFHVGFRSHQKPFRIEQIHTDAPRRLAEPGSAVELVRDCES